ncbi:hypothetical protein EDB83DRAFT_2389779 [Lactarius deliciosus]|nr:hypothetical protein EDB83DRAFT_2389779 [Lactarius deliciosus]
MPSWPRCRGRAIVANAVVVALSWPCCRSRRRCGHAVVADVVVVVLSCRRRRGRAVVACGSCYSTPRRSCVVTQGLRSAAGGGGGLGPRATMGLVVALMARQTRHDGHQPEGNGIGSQWTAAVVGCTVTVTM